MNHALSLSASALLLVSAPEAQQKPLATEALPAVLGDHWWCTNDVPSETAEGRCSTLVRYRFDGDQVHVEACDGVLFSDLRELAASLHEFAPNAAREGAPLFGSLAARARAIGAERVVLCSETTSVNADDRICTPLFGSPPSWRIRLSLTGAWEDPDDLHLSAVEVEKLANIFKRIGQEALATYPELADSEVTSVFEATAGAPWCKTFESLGDGTIQVWQANAPGIDALSIMTIAAAPTDVVLGARTAP